MSTFNLQNIISKYDLNEEILAKQLFPKNKFSKLALSRIIAGLSHLDTNQLCILSEMLGVKVSDLFIEDDWSKSLENNVFVFSKNNYKVIFSPETYLSEIYISGKLVSVETLITDKNIKLSEYLKLVESVIINLI
jgi:hypothetical protein